MTPATFKSIRMGAGLTQRQLAERVRVNPRHIRAIEAGDKTPGGPLTVLMRMIAAQPNGGDDEQA